MKKLFFWLPRLLLITFTIFLSLFSFDIFMEDWSIVEKIIGFVMHLLPTLFLVLILVITWRRPKLAAIFFFIMAVIFFIMFDGYEELMGFLIIDLPLIVISGLFFLDFKYNNIKN